MHSRCTCDVLTMDTSVWHSPSIIGSKWGDRVDIARYYHVVLFALTSYSDLSASRPKPRNPMVYTYVLPSWLFVIILQFR